MGALDDLVTTTIEKRSKVVADGVSKNNALLYKISKQGNNKLVSGGRSIYQELSHAENSTVASYSGSETIDVSQSAVLSFAEYSWKQYAGAVVLNGLEQLQNSGSEQMLDLLDERITVAENTLKNKISTDCYSDGTGNGGKNIGGLQLLVADSPSTGTVGTINRATYSWWKNIVQTGVTAKTDVYDKMIALYVQLVRGNEAPDLILADNNYWTFYHQYLSGLQQIVTDSSSSMAAAGFPSIKFMNSEVVLDGGYGGGAPANHMYFLNTKYIFLKTHRDRNFSVIGKGERQAVNQDATVKLIGWAGNMTMSNAFLQGVLKA
jgi:hypothetical protein